MKSRLKKYFRAIILSLSFGLMPALSLGAQDPWQLLDDFTPLPSSLTRISERYVAMIFVNPTNSSWPQSFSLRLAVQLTASLNTAQVMPWSTRKAPIRAYM